MDLFALIRINALGSFITAKLVNFRIHDSFCIDVLFNSSYLVNDRIFFIHFDRVPEIVNICEGRL